LDDTVYEFSYTYCTILHTPTLRSNQMPLPTWNGEPMEEGSPEMYEATLQAWAVLQEAMGSRGGLHKRPASYLLHAVEASAWLERISAVGRHLFVPIAKANGASWADLAAAMGVSRATAQHRHRQEAEEWEDSIRLAAAPGPWEGVEPLTQMEPPTDFHPSDEDFVRRADAPAWDYTGPLEPAIQYLRAHHSEVRVYSHDDVHYVSSTYEGGNLNTSADSEEEAWRAHLGHVLGEKKPSPGDARPSETIAVYRTRMQEQGR
jgi:hypothetical protein